MRSGKCKRLRGVGDKGERVRTRTRHPIGNGVTRGHKKNLRIRKVESHKCGKNGGGGEFARKSTTVSDSLPIEKTVTMASNLQKFYTYTTLT